MNPYNRRLATFSVCSSDLKLSPLLLARKGFRYDNNNFMVICDDCLVSIDNLNIAAGIGHHPGCPNFEENHTETRSTNANKVLSKSSIDFQLACLPETILEQNPWKSEGSSSSRTADESEDRSNHVNGFSRYSTGETPVTLDDGDDRELTPEWTCKICLDTEVSIVFLPCGHLVSCDQCATRLRICPICRTRILKTITALMA